MKTFKFIGYLFYRYYSKGKRANISYFSSVCAISFLLFLHLVQIILLLSPIDILPNFSNKLITKIALFLVLLPIYFIVTSLFKKREIEFLKTMYDKDWDKVFRGNVLLVIYSVLSFCFTMYLAANFNNN